MTIVGARRLDACLHIPTTAAATAAGAMAAVKLLLCGSCNAGIPWCPARAKVGWQAAMQASVAVVFKIMQGFLYVHAPGVLRHLEQQPAEVVKLRTLRQRDRDRFPCQIKACWLNRVQGLASTPAKAATPKQNDTLPPIDYTPAHL